MQWTEAAPTAAALTALLYLPGYLGLRLLGLRGLLPLAAAPAVTTAVLGVGAVAFGTAGVPWGPASVTALLAFAVAVCLGIGWWSRARPLALPPLGNRWVLTVCATTAFAAGVQLYAFVLGLGRPDAVQQIHDPIFHLNAADTIVRTGNASSLGGLDPMYGSRTGVFYPAVWPSLVALGARVSDVVVSQNMLMLVTGVGVWLVGLVALARAAAPRHPLVAAVTPVVAASFLVFPANVHVLQGIYGYTLAMSLWPGVLALLLTALRRRRPMGLVVAAAGAVGMGVAHTSAVGLLAVSALPIIGHELAVRGRDLHRAGRPAAGLVLRGIAPAAALLLVVATYTVPQLTAMGAYQRPSGDPWAALRTALLTSTTVGWTSIWANVVIAVLIVLGAVVAWRLPAARWLTIGWAVSILLYVLAVSPEGPLRRLTGLWYKDADRLLAMITPFGAVLGALGVLILARAAARAVRSVSGGSPAGPGRRRDGGAVPAAGALTAVAVLALAFVTSGAFRTDERLHGWTWWAFNPDHSIVAPAYASREELELLRDLPVADDAVVVGDPVSGAVFTQSVGDAIAYIPHINPTSWDEKQRFLLVSFADIHSDPAVCEVVRAEGIEYFYADEPHDPSWESRAPGFYGVDTATGFTLIDTADTARLYRIEACAEGP